MPNGSLLVVSLAPALALILTGCKLRPGSPRPGPGRDARPLGTTVSVVNGEAITAEELLALARAEGVEDPHAALERAIAERLLAREATRRGRETGVRLEDITRRGAIQALLTTTIEHEVGAKKLSEDDLATGMRLRGFELSHGELRVTAHGLAQATRRDSPEQRARAREAAEELRRRALALVRPQELEPAGGRVTAAEREKFRVDFSHLAEETLAPVHHKIEVLPGIDRGGRFAQGEMVSAYAQAATQLDTPGEVSPVVETEFGFHVIVLLERLPPAALSEEAARMAVREELLWRLRRRALDKFLGELRIRYRATVRESALRAVEEARFQP